METLRRWLDRFCTAKTAAGRSVRTVHWYREQIDRYLDWIALHGAQGAPDPWLPETVEDFLAGERARGLKPATVSARYRALSAWCGWLVARKHLAESPMTLVERPAVRREPVAYVRLAEFDRLYPAIAGERWGDYRDRGMLLLLFWSGLRVGELVGLRVGDVDTAARLVTVSEAKSGEGRIVPCPPQLGPALLAYLMRRPPLPGHVEPATLFVSNDGGGQVRGALTVHGVRLMLKRRCEKAGVRWLNPHAFRHGFAMEFLNAGMDMSAVSKALGHSNEQITADVYAHWLTAGLRAEYDQVQVKLQQKPQYE